MSRGFHLLFQLRRSGIKNGAIGERTAGHTVLPNLKGISSSSPGLRVGATLGGTHQIINPERVVSTAARRAKAGRGFSIGFSQVEWVGRCIEQQEQQHKKHSFQLELRTLLKPDQVQFEELYLCDSTQRDVTLFRVNNDLWVGSQGSPAVSRLSKSGCNRSPGACPITFALSGAKHRGNPGLHDPIPSGWLKRPPSPFVCCLGCKGKFAA